MTDKERFKKYMGWQIYIIYPLIYPIWMMIWLIVWLYYLLYCFPIMLFKKIFKMKGYNGRLG